MIRILSLVLSALLVIVGPAPHAAAATQKVWSYSDPTRDHSPAVDVTETRLDTKTRGNYRIRVFGSEFIKNKTDMVRLFFDTDPNDNGPDYSYTWYFGKNPAQPIGTSFLAKGDSWGLEGAVGVRCPRIKRAINYRTDLLAVTIPRSCLSRPSEIRWAGFIGRIDRADEDSLYGEFDDFPRQNSFPGQWVA